MSARRVYRRSLAALLLVLPLALWTASGEDFLVYCCSPAPPETRTAAGGSADYGGSRWQVAQLQLFRNEVPLADGAAPGTLAQTLPAGTQLLRLQLLVRAGDSEALRRLERCQVELVDASGRRWNAQSVNRRGIATRCSGSFGNTPQVAQDFRFEQDFLLPDDAVASTAARIRLDAEKPRLLRLQLR